MAWFEHQDVRIYYEEMGAGDPVLLLPGFTESFTEFGDLIDALAPHYRVIAADLPGSGRSEPQPRDFPPDLYERDAHTMLALMEHVGTGPYHLLGFSDGGESALLMGVHDKGAIRSIVVWGAAGSLDPGASHMLDAIYSLVDSPPDFWRDWHDQLVRHYGEATARSTTQSWATAARAIVDAGGHISLTRVQEIKCPVLVIAGENDPFAPEHFVSDLVSRIPNAELIVVPETGHGVHLQRRDWFNDTVLSWLSRP